MGKRSPSEKRGYGHFCFCLGLQSGAVVISLIWLCFGLTLFVVSLAALVRGTTMSPLHFIEGLTYMLIFAALIVMSIGGYGLWCVTRRQVDITRMKFYMYLVWFFTVFTWAILAITSVIMLIVQRKQLLARCRVEMETFKDKCNIAANHQTVMFGVLGFVTTVLNIYFAIILNAYIDRQKQKIAQAKRMARLSQQTYNDTPPAWEKFDWAHTSQLKGDKQ